MLQNNQFIWSQLNKKKYYFISPHLDDAILSAGALIYELKNLGKVKIITVFTKAAKKITNSIQKFTQSCNCSNSNELFLNREIEDKKLCQYLKINDLHLGFTDALWRNSYNLMEDLFLKKINSTNEEQNLETMIIDKLKKTINNNKDVAIFAPLSIGNHIDHRIINKICKDNFTNVIYWEDYPYNLKTNLSAEFIKRNKLSCFEYNKNLFIKKKLIKFYKSQISNLFGIKPIILKKERYYLDFDNFFLNTK